MPQDKGYHLLKALGFDQMAAQARSAKSIVTSRDQLNYIIGTAEARGTWEEHIDVCQQVLILMDQDEEA